MEKDKQGRFRFLEHTADAYIEAYGKNLEEAFENAAYATTDVMTEVEKVEPKSVEDFTVEGHDLSELLYSWLEELLLEFELQGMLYSRFKVFDIQKTPDGFMLHSKAWGENYNPDKHPSKVGIKAATYHQMEITENGGGAVLRFILDI
ncbi:MAG: archease [Candidatus Bathyarchaeia archaeon]|jgi:SHS2 domain-containing protein